jgi:hypothetical protein
MMSHLITNSSPNSSPRFLTCIIGKDDEMMSYIYILYIPYRKNYFFFYKEWKKKKKRIDMVEPKKRSHHPTPHHLFKPKKYFLISFHK